jgi:predicted transcriptional regulator
MARLDHSNPKACPLFHGSWKKKVSWGSFAARAAGRLRGPNIVNNPLDLLTNPVVGDARPLPSAKSLSLGFESTDAAMLAGIRVRPADLARLLGVTKQAVSKWVADGRVVLGVDGRVDPRAAINRLLTTGDPSRLRAKFLAPVIAEVTAARQRIAELERRLAVEAENAEYHEGAATELAVLVETFKTDLRLSWGALRSAPEAQAFAAIDAWLEASSMHGADPGVLIADYLPAPTKKNRGGEV